MFALNESLPTTVLFAPVVFTNKAFVPIAVLEFAVVLAERAS